MKMKTKVIKLLESFSHEYETFGVYGGRVDAFDRILEKIQDENL